jgi:hypothetical protein
MPVGHHAIQHPSTFVIRSPSNIVPTLTVRPMKRQWDFWNNGGLTVGHPGGKRQRAK